MRLRSLLPTVALLFALPALARETPTPPPPPAALPAPVPTPAPAPASDLVRKAFSIGDLVAPVPPANGANQPGEHQKTAAALIRAVTSTVRPYTWSRNGGAGQIEYHESSFVLVVHNTPEVVAAVGELIATMRRLQGPQIVYGVQVLKVPAGFFERIGVKMTPDTVLTEAALRTVLEAAEGQREASVTQSPKLTMFDGQSATIRAGQEQRFVTGLEVVKVKGQNVFVPKNTQVYLGDALTVSGTATADDKGVRLRAQFTRTALAGNVEMVPVVTQVTPIFEGGSQGKPVPVPQLIQAPDVRTNKIDRTLTAPVNGTVVLGGWKEPADAPRTKSAPKAEPAPGNPAGEFEVVVLATVRVVRAADERPATEARVYKLRNVAAADVAHALTGYARTKKQSAVVVAEAVSNSVCVLGTPDMHKQVAGLIAALDKEPLLMPLQALILDVPDGFMARTGLSADTKGGNAWTLSPREAQMFGALLRTAKEKGECDVLSRPQISVADGQTGYVQIGQSFPVQTAGGAVGFRPTGITLRVTPSALPDGKSVKLAAEMRNVTVKVALPATVPLPWVTLPAPAPVFSAEVVGGNVVAPLGHTVVFAGDPRVHNSLCVDGNGRRSEHTEKRQTIVVLTPHLVAPPAQVVPAAGGLPK